MSISNSDKNNVAPIVTVPELAQEFGLSKNAVTYHLRRLFPENNGKVFRLKGGEPKRAREYLRRVTHKGAQPGAFPIALVVEMMALAAVHGVTLRATQNEGADTRHLVVHKSRDENDAPRVQLVIIHSENLDVQKLLPIKNHAL
jgi:hypothetical protein